MSIDAMKMALEALEEFKHTSGLVLKPEYHRLLDTLRTAIEEAERQRNEKAEPVKCRHCGQDTMHIGDVCYSCNHPAPIPEGWQPSDAEIISIADKIPSVAAYDWDQDDVIAFAKALLAAAPKPENSK